MLASFGRILSNFLLGVTVMYLWSSRVTRILILDLQSKNVLLTCFIVRLIGVESEKKDFDDSHRDTKQM